MLCVIDADNNKSLEIIRRIINCDDFYQWINNGEKIKSIKKLKKGDIKYYLFKVDSCIAGFCAFRIVSIGTAIADVVILPSFRGKIAKKLSLDAVKKYTIYSKCKTIITKIDKKNKKSFYFAKWLGFKLFSEDNDNNYLRLDL